MEEQFKEWLISIGRRPATANSYANAVKRISEHYSQQENLQDQINIYDITDQNLISQLSSHYSQNGKYSEFGYESNSLYRAAINRYSEFFINQDNNQIEINNEETIEKETEEGNVTFAYEKDLQRTLCTQISALFPNYKIYQEPNKSGVEYSINGKRIDVLLEHMENKSLLAVELKSGVADYKVFGQISMYLGLLKQRFPDTKASGVIIAGAIDESLQYACETTTNIEVKIYRMSLELESV